MSIIQAFAGSFNFATPQVAALTYEFSGYSGLHQLNYTNTGGPITSISQHIAPTLGSISIVGTTVNYMSPCYQGDPYKDGYTHTGSEIDTFSLYFSGPGGTVSVIVTITIDAA